MNATLSVDDGKVYLQNANTNKYLEDKFEGKADLVDGKVPVEQLPDMDYIPTEEKGAASGVATLGVDGKVPAGQLPQMNYIPTTEKGVASGVAALGADGKVPTNQLPSMGYSEAETLSDTTKSLFGFGSSAVPNDMFSWLGQYNTHWWSVLHGQAGKGYKEVKTAFNTMDGGSTVPLAQDYSYSQTIQYSFSVSIDQETGAVSLKDPQAMTVRGASTSAAAAEYLKAIVALAPVYITNLYSKPSTIFYVPAGVTYTESFYNVSTETFGCTRYDGGYGLVLNGTKYCSKPVYTVTSEVYNIPQGETTYVHANDRNAYPDNSTVDGLTYRYMGVPFQNAVIAPRIATGSYTGTGVYGSSNKNSLTFDFVPQIVFVVAKDRAQFHGQQTTLQEWVMFINGMTKCLTKQASNNSGTGTTTIEWSEKTVSWYGSWAGAQLNTSGVEYLYVAFG